MWDVIVAKVAHLAAVGVKVIDSLTFPKNIQENEQFLNRVNLRTEILSDDSTGG